MSNICTDCGHRHRGALACPICECSWQPPLKLEEPNMFKKIFDKFVKWLFDWQK
jgi:hypothetical protein